ncbi:MAG TPA: cupin domain-containing protein [Chloroflexota bacterium]|nr:cupin domain-containing protein [Chloroflexota bacterium]
MTGATDGSRERASRWLAESMLSFDLGDEVRQLLEEAGWKQTGRTAKTLVKEADLRLVLVALRRGVAMDEHQAAGPITIQAVSGQFRVLLPEQHVNLVPGQFVALAPALRHSVQALQDGAFLLTIAWPGHIRAGTPADTDPPLPIR